MAGGSIHNLSPPALDPGEQLLRRYQIKEVLGQTARGIVYLCQDLDLNREVVLKEYLPAQFARRDANQKVFPTAGAQAEHFNRGLKRFISDAAELYSFSHPNIAAVLDIFAANNTSYVVINRERGRSLEALSERQEALDVWLFEVLGMEPELTALRMQQEILDESRLLAIFHSIIDGLEKVHARGVIHGNIHPRNIYLRDDGSPVLVDWGVRVCEDALPLTKNIVSPGYAPIEQYAGKCQGPWTDIYSLAATLYRVVTGSAPPEAIDRARALQGEGRDNYVAAKERAGGQYADRILRAIDLGLAFNWQDRPPNLREWRLALGSDQSTVTGPAREPKHKVIVRPVPNDGEYPRHLSPRRKSFRPLWNDALRLGALGVVMGLALLVAMRDTGEPETLNRPYLGDSEMVDAPQGTGSELPTPAPEMPMGDPVSIDRDGVEKPDASAETTSRAGPYQAETGPVQTTPLFSPEQSRTDKVARFLEETRRDIAASRLTTPRGNNAVEKYRQAEHYLNKAAGLSPKAANIRQARRVLEKRSGRRTSVTHSEARAKSSAMAILTSGRNSVIKNTRQDMQPEPVPRFEEFWRRLGGEPRP